MKSFHIIALNFCYFSSSPKTCQSLQKGLYFIHHQIYFINNQLSMKHHQIFNLKNTHLSPNLMKKSPTILMELSPNPIAF
jgi:hypothetical protein